MDENTAGDAAAASEAGGNFFNLIQSFDFASTYFDLARQLASSIAGQSTFFISISAIYF